MVKRNKSIGCPKITTNWMGREEWSEEDRNVHQKGEGFVHVGRERFEYAGTTHFDHTVEVHQAQ